MRTYKGYTDEQIINAVSEVRSLAGLLRKLNLKPAGGNYANMKRNLQRLNLSCSHWTGASWSKGQRMKDWSKYKRSSNFKNHLVKIKGNECESCKLKAWLNKDIPLEVHHINGNSADNSIENLQLLCPNCHYMTDNFRNRKRALRE